MVSLIRRAARRLPQPVKNGIRQAATTLSFMYNRGSVTTPDGQTFDVPSKINPSDYFALRQGNYERDEIGVLKHFFRPEKGMIIEAGANLGVVARYAIAEKLARGGTYVCIEPNPTAFDTLEANMQRASIAYPDHDIRIKKAAVGAPSQDGTEATFFSRPNLGSGLRDLVKAGAHEVAVRVPVVSLSRVIAENPSNSISFICDAEGGEIPIIYQDQAALRKVRQIAIELHGPKVTGRSETPNDMIEQLASQGFRREGGIHATHYFARRLDRA
jgi:FkbM family methyltransferase